jgi:glucoside 3-dehydrogenase (cytochrome c) hitch-hiker subunit
MTLPILGATAVAATQAADEETWQPLLFDAHQNETVIALSELIIPETDTPGAKQANVNRFIDLILHDGDDYQTRDQFIEGLGQLDGNAISAHGKPFVRCSPAQQTALVEAIQETEFFALTKRLTAQGYYTSKIGIDELNKGGIPDSFACEHTGH